MAPFTMSISEAARALGLSRTTVYLLISQQRLETLKIGRRRLVKVASIQQLLEAGQ